MTWAEAAGIYLGELNIHAVDLARTQGQKAPIAKEDALNVAYGLLAILPDFVDKQKAARASTGRSSSRSAAGRPCC